MMDRYQKRGMVSFEGRCPLQCRYCYTYDLEDGSGCQDIQNLVDSIAGKSFDIIYLSQTYENFFDQEKGLTLCKELYRAYKKDIFIITKSFLEKSTISRLACQNREMKENGNQLYLGVSVCAGDSYEKLEQKGICPSPQDRLLTLEHCFQQGIKTLLLLRPIFPDNIVPTSECLQLLDTVKSSVCAVISSGLVVTPNNLKALGIMPGDMQYLEGGDTEYLANIERDKIRFVDVENELKMIQRHCEELEIPFFRHSMPALNWIVKNI